MPRLSARAASTTRRRRRRRLARRRVDGGPGADDGELSERALSGAGRGLARRRDRERRGRRDHVTAGTRAAPHSSTRARHARSRGAPPRFPREPSAATSGAATRRWRNASCPRPPCRAEEQRERAAAAARRARPRGTPPARARRRRRGAARARPRRGRARRPRAARAARAPRRRRSRGPAARAQRPRRARGRSTRRVWHRLRLVVRVQARAVGPARAAMARFSARREEEPHRHERQRVLDRTSRRPRPRPPRRRRGAADATSAASAAGVGVVGVVGLRRLVVGVVARQRLRGGTPPHPPIRDRAARVFEVRRVAPLGVPGVVVASPILRLTVTITSARAPRAGRPRRASGPEVARGQGRRDRFGRVWRRGGAQRRVSHPSEVEPAPAARVRRVPHQPARGERPERLLRRPEEGDQPERRARVREADERFFRPAAVVAGRREQPHDRSVEHVAVEGARVAQSDEAPASACRAAGGTRRARGGTRPSVSAPRA